MAPFDILAIQAGNGGQGIDEKPVIVHILTFLNEMRYK
jgi:hypothetical protein